MRKKGPIEVPLAIGGQHVQLPSRIRPLEIHSKPADHPQITNSTILKQHDPSSHSSVVAQYSNASPADVNSAIESALAAKSSWENLPFADRAAVFLKAADLISTKYRYEIMAATMVGQGKNAWQAEIDAAAELVDFLRYVSVFSFVRARER